MLSLHPQEAYSFDYRIVHSLPTTSHFPILQTSQTFNMSGGKHPQQPSGHVASKPSQDDSRVAQALEIARESPDGEMDPTVSGILEAALNKAWSKVLAEPDYVMRPGEYAVFNFFQHRFVGDERAVVARRRYWDNTYA